jgi:hypothetical protein
MDLGPAHDLVEDDRIAARIEISPSSLVGSKFWVKRVVK